MQNNNLENLKTFDGGDYGTYRYYEELSQGLISLEQVNHFYLTNNPEMVLTAIRVNPKAVEFVIKLGSENYTQAYEHEWKDADDIQYLFKKLCMAIISSKSCLEAISYDPENLQKIWEGVRGGFHALKAIDPKYLTEKMCAVSIATDPYLEKYIPKQLKDALVGNLVDQANNSQSDQPAAEILGNQDFTSDDYQA